MQTDSEPSARWAAGGWLQAIPSTRMDTSTWDQSSNEASRPAIANRHAARRCREHTLPRLDSTWIEMNLVSIGRARMGRTSFKRSDDAHGRMRFAAHPRRPGVVGWGGRRLPKDARDRLERQSGSEAVVHPRLAAGGTDRRKPASTAPGRFRPRRSPAKMATHRGLAAPRRAPTKQVRGAGLAETRWFAVSQ